MANYTNAFREEVARLARKEIRQATASQVNAVRLLKDQVSGLKKTVADLERQQRSLLKSLKKNAPKAAAKAQEDQARVRITGKGVRSLRRKWNVTQAGFAEIMGVSVPTVVLWEKEDGALNMRSAAREAYLENRELGAREAQALLEE